MTKKSRTCKAEVAKRDMLTASHNVRMKGKRIAVDAAVVVACFPVLISEKY